MTLDTEFKYITDKKHLFSDDSQAEMPDELLDFRNSANAAKTDRRNG